MTKLTPEEAFELGNRVREAVVALHKWRIENRDHLSRSQWEELDDREVALLNFANSNFANGVGMVLDNIQAPLSRLQANIKHAESAVDHIRSFQQALDLASALILFAGAISSGNPAEIPASIAALENTVDAIVNPRGPDDAE